MAYCPPVRHCATLLAIRSQALCSESLIKTLRRRKMQRSLGGLPMNKFTRARIVITAGVLSVAALLGAVAASVAAVPAVHHHTHGFADNPEKHTSQRQRDTI